MSHPLRLRNLALLGLLTLAAAAAAPAATIGQAKNAAGQEVIVLENNLIKLAVLPSRGGRISSFVAKAQGVEMIHDPVMQGILVDHFREQGWPGEMWNAPYHAEMEQTGPQVVSVKLTYTASGKWGDSENPDLRGLVVEKTLTLHEGSPVLDVHYAIRNPGPKGKAMSFWSQSLMWPGGKAEPITYYRPSRRGVKAIYDQPDVALRDKMEEVIRDPAAGWTAALDTENHDGFVWVMDYGALQWLYNCVASHTVEFFYNKVALPAGKAWETDIAVYPVHGMNGFSGCNRALVADCQVKRDGDRVRVTHQVAGVDPDYAGATIAGNLLNPVTNATVPMPTTQVALKPEPQTAEVVVDKAPTDPLVVRLDALTARGASSIGEVLHYELWAGGTYGDNWQLQGGPVYSMPVPPSVPHYLKPDHIALTLGPQPRALLARGLFSPSLKLDEALQAAGFSEVTVAYHRVGLWGTTSLLNFPMSYDDLLAYNLVVLADVDAESLGDIGREMLKDYVAAGGGLLVLGGPYAYGEGGYGKGQLAEVLPVQVGGAFDLVAGGELAAGGASALPGSLDWKQRPVAPYVHRLTPKPQAVVAVTAGGLPFVVTGTYGQGRVACVAGSPVGAAAGRTVFWQWSDWPRLVGKLAEWARAVPPAVP